MNFLRKIKFFRYLMSLLVLLLVAGCLTSTNPFYNENDIIQDQRFIGTFVSDDLGLEIMIASDQKQDKRYLVHLIEGGKTSDYLATLFKIKNKLFVDLIPTSERKVMQQYQEGAPTASGLLQGVSHDSKILSSSRLHVLFRLSFSNKGIECFGAKKFDDPSNPITKNSKLKFHANGDGVVLEEATEILRSIVESYASTNWAQLFQDSVLELNRSKKEDHFVHSAEINRKPFSVTLPHDWGEINKGDPPFPGSYIRFQGAENTEFGVRISQKSAGASVDILLNNKKNDLVKDTGQDLLKDPMITEITQWGRYGGKGFNIEWKGQDKIQGIHITVFGFEKGDNVCILYEYATLDSYKTYASDFEKIQQTFQLK